MNIDLDLDNYSLQDITDLFQIPITFDEGHLKKAYKSVLMTHPDKSGLDKEYFLFFVKAFKLLKQIYEYSNKGSNGGSGSTSETNAPCSSSTRSSYMYQSLRESTDDVQHKSADKERSKFTNHPNFQKRFNELFDRVKIEDDEHDSGYKEWLSSNETIHDNAAIHNKADMSEAFHQAKQRTKEITLYQGIQDLGTFSSPHGATLAREAPQEYSCEVFSKLPYQDVKKAHTETVVPVDEEDYHAVQKFSSTDELKRFRHANSSLLSEKEYQEKYNVKQEKEKQSNVQRAYKMMKQMEQIEQSNALWKANFHTLMDKS